MPSVLPVWVLASATSASSPVVAPTATTTATAATSAIVRGARGKAHDLVSRRSRLAARLLLGAALADRLLNGYVFAIVPALDLLAGHAAALSFLVHRVELGKREQCGAYRVDRVVVAERLGQDVVDARGLNHRTHAATRDHACTGGSRLQEHLAGAVGHGDFVRNGVADERHADHVLARIFPGFADRLGYFRRLACARTHCAAAVADHYHRTEAETATALDHLGHAVHLHQPLLELRRSPLNSCHCSPLFAF